MKFDGKRLAAAVCVTALAVAGAFMINKREIKRSETFFAMDCACTVTMYGGDISPVKERISELDKKLSAYGEDSEIYKVNSEGQGTLSDETAELVERSLDLTEKYGGADITAGALTKLWNVTGESPSVPSDEEIAESLATVGSKNVRLEGNVCTLENGAQLDFGCDGKGFALDEVKKELDRQDVSCAVATFGSSSLLYGEKPDGKSFTTSVTDPFDDGKTCLSFTSGECFVSTSGGYERYFEADGEKYCHIFDLSTGYPCKSDLVSVTVVCQSGIRSDFLSTCIYLGGTDSLDKWLHTEDIEVIAIGEDKSVYCSDSIKSRITVNNNEFVIKTAL